MKQPGLCAPHTLELWDLLGLRSCPSSVLMRLPSVVLPFALIHLLPADIISQAPLTATDTAILSGSLSTQNGNGGGSVNFALRRVTSAKGWGEVRTLAGGTLSTSKPYF